MTPHPCAQTDGHLIPHVSCLPSELLVKIFEYLATDLNPTVLLQVCHRWADIASLISSLWFKIDFSTPPTPFLQRSIDRPIEVTLVSSPVIPTSRQLKAAKKVLLSHGSRIRRLVLDLLVVDLLAIGPELSSTFPILVDVSISAVHSNNQLLPVHNFPSRISFAATSPARYLRLLLVKTPWTPGRFENLVEFLLHDQSDANFDPPMEVFLGILESSPQLAVLSVANAGPRLPTDTIALRPATRVVDLPSLQRLYLEQENPCDVGWILTHLSIPCSADVRIFIDLNPGGRATFPLDLVFDRVLPNHPGLPHLINLHCCTYAISPRPASLITTTNFALCIAWGHIYTNHCEYLMLPFLRRAAAAGAIEDLSIVSELHTRHSISGWHWNQIFGTLSSLRKLTVEQPWADVDFPIRDLLQSQQCPTLRNLQLVYAAFRRGTGRENEGKLTPKDLVDFCAKREREGYRLESLVIEAPSNAPLDLASLLAPHVDCVEVREDVSRDEDIWAVEFGSRRVFYSLQGRRLDGFDILG